MKKTDKIKLELLAPAKNADIAIEAVKHGADAVYMGATRYGARSSASNSLEDIKRAVDYAHKFNARIYVTVNTIILEDELADVEHLIHELYNIGVDALIVQDIGILRMSIPPIALHASTQCDIRTPDKAEFLEQVGFSQLVMARELSLDEIKAIRERVTVPLEAFVHGALCVSYSGRCGMSYACMKRSANRGECAQMCRLPYDLVDDNDNVLVKNKHLLSLRDLNQSSNLKEMIDAGVSSFKIEGRLKDIDYVKNVVAYYNQELNKIVADNPDLYERSSKGTVNLKFLPQLDKVFNRSFTSYFLKNRNLSNGYSIASINTPKSMGEYVGTVVSSRSGNMLKVTTSKTLSNGDGFSYFDVSGTYTGFRVNKVDGDMLFLSQPLKLPKPVKLYRTYDNVFNNQLTGDTAKRTISINMKLSMANCALSLDISDERGNYVTSTLWLDKPLDIANMPQYDKQRGILGKLGNTIYKVNQIETIGDYFIPSSFLVELRRKSISLLDAAQKTSYNYDYRRNENLKRTYYTDRLQSSDNVANHLSERFYKEHGVASIDEAIETKGYRLTGDEVLMHTRYCLLRELGCCRKYKSAKKLPERIYLKTGSVIMRVVTDCSNCEMKITLEKKPSK